MRRYMCLTRLVAGSLIGVAIGGISRSDEPKTPIKNRAPADFAEVAKLPAVGTPKSAPTTESAATLEPPVLPAPPVLPVQPAQPAVSCADGCPKPLDWTKIPPVRNPFPRPGAFLIPPDGCGFYSVLDLIKHKEREKPPKNPYPPQSIYAGSFFDADYRYLDDPANTQHDWLDFMKRIHIGDKLMFSTGGEFRYRLMDELASRLTATDQNYNLIRTRVYGDLSYGDRLRAYIEFIEAHAFHETLAPLAIDQNPADILNLFVDLKILEDFGTPGYLRVGRQELLYGSQRLISPLDWANTRRTFQGMKLFFPSEKWDLDMFWVKPVPVSATEFDWWDPGANFYGLWASYKPKKGTVRDFYVLNYHQPAQVPIGTRVGTGSFDITTFGTRWAGDHDGRFLYDFEGMIQTGIRANTEVAAYAGTAGLGYCFKDCRMKPTFWVYEDYASGDSDPTTGRLRTFNQLFPFGHYYFGFLDLVGRQNINDLNAQASIYPTRWSTLLFQYHHFTLAQPQDALYNAGGVAIRRDPTGASGRYVGDEFDIAANIHISQHADLFLGVSALVPGPFLQNNAPPPRTPQLFYLQYSYKW